MVRDSRFLYLQTATPHAHFGVSTAGRSATMMGMGMALYEGYVTVDCLIILSFGSICDSLSSLRLAASLPTTFEDSLHRWT